MRLARGENTKMHRKEDESGTQFVQKVMKAKDFFFIFEAKTKNDFFSSECVV